MSRRILLLRHGERLDEIGQSSDSFDPGLSGHGFLQAKTAWEGIAKNCEGGYDVYTSPMKRTLETAAPPDYTQPTTVKIVPGLASCAAAVGHFGGIRSPHLPDPVLLDHSKLLSRAKTINPSTTFSILDDSSFDSSLTQFSNDTTRFSDKQFLNAVLACVEDSDAEKTCVIVTHREGIRNLTRKLTDALRRPHISYCCVASYRIQQTDPSTTPPPLFSDWWYEECRSFEEFAEQPPPPPPPPLFRFGVIADVQYCNIPDGTSFDGKTKRHFRGALTCLHKAVAEWSTPNSNVAFVAQLGDIIDNQCNLNKQTKEDFSTIIAAFEPLKQQFIPIYNCIGNHELYNFSRAELASGPLNTAPGGISYYSFLPAPGWRFLVLDPYQSAIIGLSPDSTQHKTALANLQAHNPNDVLSACDWSAGLSGDLRRWVPYNGGLGEAQLAWMRAELQAATVGEERVVMLCHVLLHPEAATGTTMTWDFEEAAEAMEGLEGCVAAVLCGHDHQGGYVHDTKTGIHHVTFQSPLNCGRADMCHATVEVFGDRLSIQGRGIVPSRELRFE